MSDEQSNVAAFYNAVASGYGDQYKREQMMTSEVYPANYFRLQILCNRLAHLGCKSLYEVGVGEGTPLAVVAGMGIDVAGCDVSPEMVRRAQDRLATANVARERIQHADIEDSVTFANHLAKGQYDAAIAFGVIPHIRNDSLFIRNLRMLVRPGGRLFVEFRNKLFSLFTLNRYTKEFILDDLLAGVNAAIKKRVAQEIDKRLAVELPPRREKVGDSAPGYDVILSRFHNPFELADLFEHESLRVHKIHWYHYHPAMPMLEKEIGPKFREEAMRLEHEDSGWRGYFLCSAGIIESEYMADNE